MGDAVTGRLRAPYKADKFALPIALTCIKSNTRGYRETAERYVEGVVEESRRERGGGRRPREDVVTLAYTHQAPR